MSRKKSTGYFDNEIMLNLFKEKYELMKNSEVNQKMIDRIDNKIGRLYMKVAEGVMKRPNFINYPLEQKSEMISNALFCMSRAGKRYDLKYTNPFGYFSQITFHSFIQSIKDMKDRIGMFVSINHVENMDGIDDQE